MVFYFSSQHETDVTYWNNVNRHCGSLLECVGVQCLFVTYISLILRFFTQFEYNHIINFILNLLSCLLRVSLLNIANVDLKVIKYVSDSG